MITIGSGFGYIQFVITGHIRLHGGVIFQGHGHFEIEYFGSLDLLKSKPAVTSIPRNPVHGGTNFMKSVWKACTLFSRETFHETDLIHELEALKRADHFHK